MCHDWKPEDPAVFQDENGQIGCKTCPADTSTLGVGSSPAGLRFLGQDVQSLFGWCVFLMDHDQRHDGSILAKPSGFDFRFGVSQLSKDPIFWGEVSKEESRQGKEFVGVLALTIWCTWIEILHCTHIENTIPEN